MIEVALWGTRGSLATPGADTARYGGNTSCVQVVGSEGTVLVLDAGTGIRPLGNAIGNALKRVDVLLSHLHMDHIQGLGFFAPLYNPEMEVHVWGPASTKLSLKARLIRYLSPPLFPVHLRDLPCKLILHELPCGRFDIGEFRIDASLVCHPGPTVGYRIAAGPVSVAYLPDHEPALGDPRQSVSCSPDWTSGFALAEGSNLLIHDAQYTDEEYRTRVGWGHSSFRQAFEFSEHAGVKHLVPFHHDPSHSDETLDKLFMDAVQAAHPAHPTTPAMEGLRFRVE